MGYVASDPKYKFRVQCDVDKPGVLTRCARHDIKKLHEDEEEEEDENISGLIGERVKSNERCRRK